jgi:hypothetical protein
MDCEEAYEDGPPDKSPESEQTDFSLTLGKRAACHKGWLCRMHLDNSSENVKFSYSFRNDSDLFVSTEELKKRQNFDLLQ